jgi:hypothetical protein
MTSPKIDGVLDPDRKKIVRLKDDGYQPYVAVGYDRLWCEYLYLFMWKTVNGKLKWAKIGPYGDEKMRLLKELGMYLKIPPSDGSPITPPSEELPTHPLTRLPVKQALPPKEPAASSEDRLRSDFMYYKTNDYVFMLRKKKDTFYLTVHRRSDSKGKEIDLGPYEGLIEKMCEELDIDIADVRRLKAKGWNFRRSVAKGSLTARGTDETGKRREFYIGVYEGPLVKLCKKYGIVIESE